MFESIDDELWNACRDGDIDTVNNCLNEGADADVRYRHGPIWMYNFTPLLAAVYNNRNDIVAELLDYQNLDFLATDDFGNTALHMACQRDMSEIVSLLGDDQEMTPEIINKENGNGKTALMLAVEESSLYCIEELRELDGVDWNTVNKQGEYVEDVAWRLRDMEVLSCFFELDDAEITDELMNRPGDIFLHPDKFIILRCRDEKMTPEIINTKDKKGMTVLMYAVEKNHMSCVEQLSRLEGLDFAVANSYRYTALHLACSSGNSSCIEVFGNYSRLTPEIINAKNVHGETASLMLAVEEGHLSCVEEMAKLDGVDWETRNDHGVGLKDVARRLNKTAILNYVCERNARKRKTRDDDDESPRPFKKIKMSTLSELIENMKSDMKREEEALQEKHDEILDEVEMEYRITMNDLENELKAKVTILKARYEKEKETLSQQHEIKMDKIETLEMEVNACDSRSTPAPPLPPTPECPICLESLAPPARMYNCPEGHIICAECRTKVANCHFCRKRFQGRATAMEQYLRAVFGVE